MADSTELLDNLQTRKANLRTHRKRLQDQIDALVEGIASRRTALKSVSQKIVELEEQKEQLEDELLDVDMEIETTKKKAVSAQSLTELLTTFSDLYRQALPQERRELIRLRVNQLIWTPEQIQLGLHDQPEPCQGLVESQHLVARTLDSLNHPASGISSIFIKDIGGTPRSSASAVGTVPAASK
jgi:chromosome segregation ATPase